MARAATSGRPGRRPAGSGTREAILAAARDAFMRNGYDGASIREIARGAGVDPALVHHYFGTKQGVFTAAMDFPIDPGMVIEQILAGPRDTVGERLVRLFLAVWESESARAPIVALIRSAASNEQAAAMLREFVSEALVARVAEALDVPDAHLRPALIGSQVIGLVFMRYVIKLEPLASADPERLVAALAPTVQRYLTGDLSSALSSDLSSDPGG
jgi:AcrR family transcriptional regulator